jgi:hypothetical protein
MLFIAFGDRVKGQTLTPCTTFADFRSAANRNMPAGLVSGMARACKTQKPITFAIGSVPIGQSGAKDVTGADFAATPFCKSAPAS